MITIKLYDNGKLYDCDRSQYIAIADLKQLYTRVDFKIIHNKSKEDCTRLVVDLLHHKTALDCSKAKASVMRLLGGTAGEATVYAFPFSENDIPF